MQKHLAILGGGTAAFAGARRALELGARVTLFNKGLPMGGTCLNVGCVPSKTLIRAAEAHHRAQSTPFMGLRVMAELQSFGAVTRQKQELVEELRERNYEQWTPREKDLEYIPEPAQLGPDQTVVSPSHTVQPDVTLIATGTRPMIPDVPGLASSGYLTNESAFALEDLPQSLIVLGGGYIALECAQMFSRFGCKTTVLQRSSHILSDQPAYLGTTLTRALNDEGLPVVCKVTLKKVQRMENTVNVLTTVDGKEEVFSAQHVLVATGRTPNVEKLGLEKQGPRQSTGGYIHTNATFETSVPTIYAAGDVIGDPQFVYTASYEAERAVENALTGSTHTADYQALPWVIFTDPQVAGVGLDIEEAQAMGIDADMAVLEATRWPKLKVAHDPRGFLRLVRDRKKDHLIGARVVVAEGGDLMTEIAMAIRYKMPVEELKNGLYPYLTLSEGIQRAALHFERVV